jgi:outer membrane protein OmpA-like peptidoglycan-associated protein
MNTTIAKAKYPLVVAAVAAALLAACAAAPIKPDGAAEARNKLLQLQSDPNLANRAPMAVHEAETAVSLAEQPEADPQLAAYRVYLADRKVETARAEAETRLAEDQRVVLSAQRAKAQLDARTREADVASSRVDAARAESAEQKAQADAARGAADAAQAATARGAADAAQAAALSAQQRTDAAEASQAAALNAQQQAAELQRQIAELQAKQTDRGLVLTLGDVLFATGRADLRTGANGNLNRLVAFLNKYPDRTVNIDGYTDSVGSEDYNLGLSQRRADSVRSYLLDQGVRSDRLAASGKGESAPVAGNDTATGRQQNRRVEVVISNQPKPL